jgi:hypothetical protein
MHRPGCRVSSAGACSHGGHACVRLAQSIARTSAAARAVSTSARASARRDHARHVAVVVCEALDLILDEHVRSRTRFACDPARLLSVALVVARARQQYGRVSVERQRRRRAAAPGHEGRERRPARARAGGGGRDTDPSRPSPRPGSRLPSIRCRRRGRHPSPRSLRGFARSVPGRSPAREPILLRTRLPVRWTAHGAQSRRGLDRASAPLLLHGRSRSHPPRASPDTRRRLRRSTR